MEKVRVGIVGAGFAARFHLECYRRVYSIPVEVVGLTSLRMSRRGSISSEFGVKSFDSVEELVGVSDLVDVCTPGYAHEKIAIKALEAGCHVAIEKPLTGYYGDGTDTFRGNLAPKSKVLAEAVASADRILDAAERAKKRVMYGENWVYSPSVQKEVELMRSAKSQILWMIGEESHSGSHSDAYGVWSLAGGGALVGKGCHPLTAALYLKFQEGLMRDGRPINAASVSANVHGITRLPAFRDEGFLRTDYRDVEDYSQLHVTFSDGTLADVFASDLVLGGVAAWLEVRANNHRSRCNISPVDNVTTYNPREDLLKDAYVMEKIGTKQGWNNPAPDEKWTNGNYQEIQDFVECAYIDREPLSSGALGRECVAVMYSAYLSAERNGQRVEVPR